MDELRKVFQQHARDEKKDLLPAVLKALTDEDAEAVIEKIETAKAEVEEAKRIEAEERRSSRSSRAWEEAEQVQQVAENVSATPLGLLPKQFSTLQQTAQAVAQTGLNTTSQVMQGAADQVALRPLAASVQRSQDLTEGAAQNLNLLVHGDARCLGRIS